MKNLKDKYKVSKQQDETSEHGGLIVTIYQITEDGDEEIIGNYHRNYNSFFYTFLAFERNGKEYALYSKDYETTSIMSLPDCKHIADTKSYFCPVDFYIPEFKEFNRYKEIYENSLKKELEENNEKKIEKFRSYIDEWHQENKLSDLKALVGGCEWGDDSGGLKLAVIDLSKLEEGFLTIKKEFGYFELPILSYRLEEMIKWDYPRRLNLPLMMTYNLNEDEQENGFFGESISNLNLYKGKHYRKYFVEEMKK